jgi:hypothetical protein
MFVESITAPGSELAEWNERMRLLTDPPAHLIASIAWQGEDGLATSVNVWDSPEAVADFFVERVAPLLEAGGEPSVKPIRHGEPVAVYLRGVRSA